MYSNPLRWQPLIMRKFQSNLNSSITRFAEIFLVNSLVVVVVFADAIVADTTRDVTKVDEFSKNLKS